MTQYTPVRDSKRERMSFRLLCQAKVAILFDVGLTLCDRRELDQKERQLSQKSLLPRPPRPGIVLMSQDEMHIEGSHQVRCDLLCIESLGDMTVVLERDEEKGFYNLSA